MLNQAIASEGDTGAQATAFLPPGVFVSRPKRQTVLTPSPGAGRGDAYRTILTHTDLCGGFKALACFLGLNSLVLRVMGHTHTLCVFCTLCVSPALHPWGKGPRQCTGGLAGSFSPLKSWRKKTNSRLVGLGTGDLPRTPHGGGGGASRCVYYPPPLFSSPPSCSHLSS